MSRIRILIAATEPDLKAKGIAAAVTEPHHDMELVQNRIWSANDRHDFAVLERLLQTTSLVKVDAIILVGRPSDTNEHALHFLKRRVDLVVLQVDIIGDHVRFDLRDPSLATVLSTVRELVERVDKENTQRFVRVQLEANDATAHLREANERSIHYRPLLQAASRWLHMVLCDAVRECGEDDEDMRGFSQNRRLLLQSLDAEPSQPFAVHALDTELRLALAEAIKNGEPLAKAEPLAVFACALPITFLDFKFLLLTLATELDERFQRCFGYLLDDVSRRTGTKSLFGRLLGAAPHVAAKLSQSVLGHWLAFENRAFSADEPLRLDPYLAQWLLGDRNALVRDGRVRRALRLSPWQGAEILHHDDQQAIADSLWRKLSAEASTASWQILGGEDPTNWRAILELGARKADVTPLRIEPTRLANIDQIELEDCAMRLGRLARLSGSPIVIDAVHVDQGDTVNDPMEAILAVLERIGCRGAIICCDQARIVRQLGSARFEMEHRSPLSARARIDAVSAAASGAGVSLDEEEAKSLANRYPLSVDALEQAMRLAISRPGGDQSDNTLLRRFTEACKERATEGLSRLVDRIEPVFGIDDIVLPVDRKRQLSEIVDHVRLAPKVLNDWKFGEKLPYGRGVTALFFGSSGTGKTMAAMGVARSLGVQLLRLDLSRVVSKYIGETEKNIDRAFDDARRSGSAILIDEADALLGKRSEVKDAHDRYANIEVAYLLQRMEAHEGLAILTTNMRQNLDTAFLRRLRFVIDFPRPDAASRELIWRFCLPDGSHNLDSAAFRLLARKIDMTGGHIRQITLRAAFMAAATNSQITLSHISDASRAECAKLGLPIVEIDVNLDRRVA